MAASVISIRELGKRYTLNRLQSYGSLRESISGFFRRLPGRALDARGEGIPDESQLWALRDISLEVASGEVLGIIGRNGAGKSTLLKLLSRITAPTEGEIEIRGRVGSLLEVGTGFHPELSGRENIYLNGAILGMSRCEIQSKFDEIVDFSETEKFLDTPVKRYSSGMYMRLAFAVAAHLEPEVLVIDEVLAVGDIAFQQKCLGKMKDVAKHGRTVLFVSHNMNAIQQLCTSVVMLDNGRVALRTADVDMAVRSYLFGREQDTQPSVWVNDKNHYQNPWFKPVQLSLTDDKGQIAVGPQANNAFLWITIEAEVDILDPALTIGYAIYNENGVALYWSYQTDSSPETWPKISKGRVTLRSKLPTKLLNEGTYRIELLGGLSFRQWLFEPGQKVPTLFFTIAGGVSDSPLWTLRRPTVLAPVLQWEVA